MNETDCILEQSEYQFIFYKTQKTNVIFFTNVVKKKKQEGETELWRMKTNVSTLRKNSTPPDSITIWSVTITILHLPFTALLRKMNRFPDAIIHCCEESKRKTQLSKRRKRIRTTVFYKRMCVRKADSTGTIRRYKVQF
jgi:hypothetical protein